jgi:nucleotide-binding universal stress UspA family protein
MTIVCATHFTASSTDAVAVAAHLARRTAQPLWLVCVLPGLPLGPSGPREKTVSDALHLEAGVLREQGLEVEVALLHGKVERALGRLCADVRAQLLVIGDTSHTKTSLFATPVDRIAYGVAVPLIVVRSKKPFEAWAKGERPLEVLLAIDHTWSSALAREWLGGLAAYGPLNVLATHVWSPADEHSRRGGDKPMLESDEATLAEVLMQDATAALVGLPPNVTWRVQLEVGRGNIGEQLLTIAARERVDMMVLGTHPQKGLLARLTSVSHEVLQNALMSVALVPGEGAPAEAMARATPSSSRGLKERPRRST